MPMTKTIYAPGEYYHSYNRGVNRQPIFFAQHNWGFFIRRLVEYFQPDLVDIIAYCLMPNHYHLLVHLKDENFSHAVMQPFGTSYTKAINKEQERVGPLFQGQFKGKHVDNQDYLTHLSRYIHRNPVDARLVASPGKWVFSSYQDYVGLRNGTLPKPDIVLSQFASVADYRAYAENQDEDDKGIEHLLFD